MLQTVKAWIGIARRLPAWFSRAEMSSAYWPRIFSRALVMTIVSFCLSLVVVAVEKS